MPKLSWLVLPSWLRWSAAPIEAPPLQRRNFINVQIDGIGVGLASAAAPFLPVFLVRLGATNFQVGLLTTMPAITGLLLAVAVGRFLQRQRNVVPWYGRVRVFSIMAYTFTGLVTLVVPSEHAVLVVLAIWAAATIPQTLVAISFTVVMNGVAGENGRYELMSRRWSVLGITTAVTVLLIGQVLARVSFPANYQLVFILLSAGGLISLYFSSHLVLPDREPPPPSARQPMLAQLGSAIQNMRMQPAFIAFTARRFVFLSGIALAAPIFPLYLVREAHATEAAIGLISTAQTFTLVIGYWLWAGVSRARGSRLVLLSATLGLSIYPALVATTLQVEVIVLLAALSGIFQAGLQLVFFDELMKTVPPDQTPLFVSIAQSLQYMSAIAAPLIGTLLADYIGLGGALLASAALRALAFLLFVRGSGVGGSSSQNTILAV